MIDRSHRGDGLCDSQLCITIGNDSENTKEVKKQGGTPYPAQLMLHATKNNSATVCGVDENWMTRTNV